MLIKGLNVTQQMVDTIFIYSGIMAQPAKIILDVDLLWEYFSQVGKVDACMIMHDAANMHQQDDIWLVGLEALENTRNY